MDYLEQGELPESEKKACETVLEKVAVCGGTVDWVHFTTLNLITCCESSLLQRLVNSCSSKHMKCPTPVICTRLKYMGS